MGWIINVRNINVKIQSGYFCHQIKQGALLSKAKLETYVNTFEKEALMSEHKLAIYIDKTRF